jgi:hypothetical protein
MKIMMMAAPAFALVIEAPRRKNADSLVSHSVEDLKGQAQAIWQQNYDWVSEWVQACIEAEQDRKH